MADMVRPSRYQLSDFVTPIGGGVSATTDPQAGVLSVDKAEELDTRLRDLDQARQRAEAESRDYRLH
jgi:hypothetical protein